jgi:hypothetical protein
VKKILQFRSSFSISFIYSRRRSSSRRGREEMEYYGVERVARKEYKCHFCGSEIKKGEKYIWRKPLWRDEPFQICTRHNVGPVRC